MKVATTFFWLALVLFSAGDSARASDQATIEAAKKEGSLMVYNSMTPSQMQLIINAFKAKYPFVEVKVYRAVGERLLTKIFTEAQAGRHDFDVLQSGDTQAYFLKKKNLLGKYMSPEAKYLPKIFVDSEGYWAAMYSMPKIIGYNTRMVRRAEVPRTDEELLNPKWKGKIATDHTKPEPFFWIMQRMGHEKGIAYLKKPGCSGHAILRGALSAHKPPSGRRVPARLVHLSPQRRRSEEQGCAGGMGGAGPGIHEISTGFRSRQGPAPQCGETLRRFRSLPRRTKAYRLDGTRTGPHGRADEYRRSG